MNDEQLAKEYRFLNTDDFIDFSQYLRTNYEKHLDERVIREIDESEEY